ncbi:MAG: hypothetical protein IJO09_08265 [Oscillospiraceae bacterium]|nr:hypothetical protein [Oscillospiraceae bacterium]
MHSRFEDFTSYVTAAYKYVMKIKAHEMKILGLRGSHVMCLFYIGKSREGITPSELTYLCVEDKAAISKTLSELKGKELVMEDNNNGIKKYKSKFFLTSKGKKIFSKINEVSTLAVEAGGEGLSDEDRATFYRSFELIINNLKKFCEKEPLLKGE